MEDSSRKRLNQKKKYLQESRQDLSTFLTHFQLKQQNKGWVSNSNFKLNFRSYIIPNTSSRNFMLDIYKLTCSPNSVSLNILGSVFFWLSRNGLNYSFPSDIETSKRFSGFVPYDHLLRSHKRHSLMSPFLFEALTLLLHVLLYPGSYCSGSQRWAPSLKFRSRTRGIFCIIIVNRGLMRKIFPRHMLIVSRNEWNAESLHCDSSDHIPDFTNNTFYSN